MGGCATLLDTDPRREASSLLSPVCPSLNVLQAHPRHRSDRVQDGPSVAELAPLKGTCSQHPNNRHAPRRDYDEIPRGQLQSELPSRDKSMYKQHPPTSVHLNGAAKQADERISTPLISRLSVVTTNFLRGLRVLPQNFPWGRTIRAMDSPARRQPVLTSPSSSSQETSPPRPIRPGG